MQEVPTDVLALPDPQLRRFICKTLFLAVKAEVGKLKAANADSSGFDALGKVRTCRAAE